LISRLNPIIHGWANYFSTMASKRTFSKMDYLLYGKLQRWAKRRHPNWPMKKVVAKYWRLETGRWDFAAPKGARLFRYVYTPIRRHTKVVGTKSFYDGDWVYWGKRLGRHPELPKRVAALLKRQAGKCAWCGLYFQDADLPEIDHIIPLANGGADGYDNWQLLHRHCHDRKTSTDYSSTCSGASDKSHSVEEPDEAKCLTSGFEDESTGRPVGLV
jgi:RNA-directed DNA polymerase